MNDLPDPPADIRTVRKLYRDGLLSDTAYREAIRILRPQAAWFAWARQMLLLFGTALVLAGIIFFFAYNWARMGRFVKFGVIEAAIIGCIIGAFVRGGDRLSGKVLIMSASVLVGILLAVYGQIYQTGADAYELFVGWSVLVFGWVIISEFAALWVVWLILINTGAVLYWFQVGEPARLIAYEYLCLLVALINGIALVLREAGASSGFPWLSGRWHRAILTAALLAPLSIPAIHLIVEPGRAGGLTAIGAGTWAVTAFGTYLFYRCKLKDMVPLALITMNAGLVLLTFIGKLLFHDIIVDESGMFLLFALIILGVATGAAYWLRETAAAMAKESEKTAGGMI